MTNTEDMRNLMEALSEAKKKSGWIKEEILVHKLDTESKKEAVTRELSNMGISKEDGYKIGKPISYEGTTKTGRHYEWEVQLSPIAFNKLQIYYRNSLND